MNTYCAMRLRSLASPDKILPGMYQSVIKMLFRDRQGQEVCKYNLKLRSSIYIPLQKAAQEVQVQLGLAVFVPRH